VFQPGDMFDRYRIEAVLGEGGMGLVYRAYDTRLRRRVALKVVRPEVAREEDGRTLSEAALRLMREGKAASAFNHPNAVSVLDVGEIDGTPYIAMELVHGRALNEFIGDERVPLAQRVEWLVDVARGLGAAHRHGIVHRDVKPENVMVADDGTIKVLDFGVAKQLKKRELPDDQKPTVPGPTSQPSFVTSIGIVIGTPMYMAPEQVLDEPLDGRSDQFAWGAVAYELLSGGIHPVTTNNPRHLPVQFAILQERPKPLREVAPGVPERIETVVMRALSRSPEDRFESMEAAARALEGQPGTDPQSAPTLAIVVPPPIDPPPTEDAGYGITAERVSSGRGLRLPILSRASAARRSVPWRFMLGWLGSLLLALGAAWFAYRLFRAPFP
jgi:eukaryotic-like serine/threonine-protein kinase